MTHRYSKDARISSEHWATCRNDHTTRVTFHSCRCCLAYRDPEGTCPVCTQPVRWFERRDDIERSEVWPPDEGEVA